MNGGRTRLPNALKFWGALRGAIPNQIAPDVLPTVQIDEAPTGPFVPLLLGIQCAAAVAGNSQVQIANVDTPGTAPGQGSLLAIDELLIPSNSSTLVRIFLDNFATAGWPAPQSASIMDLAQEQVLQHDLTLPLCTINQNNSVATLGAGGQITLATAGVTIRLPLNITLPPGAALFLIAQTVNVPLNVLAVARFYHAP